MPYSQHNVSALIIDDNAPNRQLAAALLDIHGIASREAPDGESGLAVMEQDSFDLVLLDISMPGIDGMEVCRRIRENPKTRDAYVVAYTAHAFSSDKRAIAAASFDMLLIKPITLKALGSAIEPMLDKARQDPWA